METFDPFHFIWLVAALILSWPVSGWILDAIQIPKTWVKRVFLSIAFISLAGNMGAFLTGLEGNFALGASLSFLLALVLAFLIMKQVLCKHPSWYAWRWIGYCVLTVAFCLAGSILLYFIRTPAPENHQTFETIADSSNNTAAK